jgi:hypothetical protein
VYAGLVQETGFSAYDSRARNSGNKTVASAHVMGSGVLDDDPVDAMAIGCLGVDRHGERFFVLSHFPSCPKSCVFQVIYSVQHRRQNDGVHGTKVYLGTKFTNFVPQVSTMVLNICTSTIF